jgi:uncharacterized protein YodC (DUF2158 family)
MFKVGDTVRLKSGGPLMTVEKVGSMYAGGDVRVYCVWFEKNAQQRGNFPPEALEADDGSPVVA